MPDNEHIEPGIERVVERTEPEFPVGDDLVWYEMQNIMLDFQTLQYRVEKLGRHMKHTLGNNVQMNKDLLDRVRTLSAELAALKGVTNV